ncbi:MAG: reverse transcriptase family protein [Candidatus Omnitrophica bacterium]|nr:reverse transcriptase family protein [Candidatus Omnitrophota bacterium]
MSKANAENLALTATSFFDLIKIDPSSLQSLLANKRKYYSVFFLPKKKGGSREITPSKGLLKTLQYRIKSLLDARIKWPPYLHGGIKGRSVLTNADRHVGHQMVVNLDIKDCFPSTTDQKVKDALLSFGLDNDLAQLVTDICTFKGHVPQGAPTSTCIVNLVLRAIDKDFYGYCKRRGFHYSRFVDDITISADQDLRPFKNVFHGFIEAHDYQVSQYLPFARNKRQIVTGLVVNDKLRPTFEFIQDLKSNIKAGWPENNTLELVANEYGLSIHQLKANIWGRVAFVRSIDNKLGRKLRGLLAKVRWNYE